MSGTTNLFDRYAERLRTNLTIPVLISVFAGLSVSYFTDGFPFDSLICVFAALFMIYPSLVSLPFERLSDAARNWRAVLASIILNFVVSPVLAYGIGTVFLSEYPALRIGLFLLSVLPGGGMVASWASRARADMPSTIGMALANLAAAVIIVPFVFPLMADSVMPAPAPVPVASCSIEQASGGAVGCGIGADGTIGPADLVVPMAVIIVIPLLLAYLTRFAFTRLAGKESLTRSVPRFSAVGNVGLLGTLFVLMGLSGNKVLFSRPEEAIAGIVPVLLYYAGIFFSARAVANRLFSDAVGRAVFFGSYLRYVTLALGFSISISFQDEKLLPMTIVIALAYLVQIPSSARIADRVGSAVDRS
jgi:ACR3 family arsenite efflux pump ArsB